MKKRKEEIKMEKEIIISKGGQSGSCIAAIEVEERREEFLL